MGLFERCFHEGSICRGHRSVIYFILTIIFVNFIVHGDWFYNQGMNSKIRTKYPEDNGTAVKPIPPTQNHTQE